MSKRSKIIIVVVVVLAIGAVVAWQMLGGGVEVLEPGQLTVSEETKRLATGEILVIRMEPTGGTGAAAMVKALVDAPVATVWPAVRDCQHFDQFMPRVEKSELREHDGEGMLCYTLVKLPFLKDLESETLSTIEEPTPGSFKRTWVLHKGTFTHNNGSYLVEPFQGDANRSLVTYTIDAKPSIPIPDAMLKQAQSKTLPKLMEKLREHVGAK